MVNPLVVTILGRGVWVAAGAAVGYLLAGGRGDKMEPATDVMREISPGHIGFIVKNYEVTKVLPPGAGITQEELQGIINVRFTGHLPQQIALEIQRLLSKGKIKLGAIESCVEEDLKQRLSEALEAKQISEIQKIIGERHGNLLGQQFLDKEHVVGQICFWVWMIDRMKKYHYSPTEMEGFGIVESLE